MNHRIHFYSWTSARTPEQSEDVLLKTAFLLFGLKNAVWSCLSTKIQEQQQKKIHQKPDNLFFYLESHIILWAFWWYLKSPSIWSIRWLKQTFFRLSFCVGFGKQKLGAARSLKIDLNFREWLNINQLKTETHKYTQRAKNNTDTEPLCWSHDHEELI